MLVFAAVLSHYLIRKFRGKWIIRFLIVLPWAAPVALATLGWLWLFDSLYSVINWTLARLGLDEGSSALALSTSRRRRRCLAMARPPNLALIAITLVQAWRVLPFAVVIFIAGPCVHSLRGRGPLQGRRRDGNQEVRLVDVPLQLPIALVAVLFGIVFTAVDFAVVYILTRGGPFNSTQVLPTWAFFIGVDGGSLGEGAAISLFLFPLLVVVTVAMLFFARRAQVS